MNCANCDTQNIHPLPNEDVSLCSKACRDERELRMELLAAKRRIAEATALMRRLCNDSRGVALGLLEDMLRWIEDGVK